MKSGLIEKNATSGQDVSLKSVIKWAPWVAVVFVIVVYYLSQVFGALALSVYPAFKHWDQAQANNWVQTSVWAQFIYVLIAEALTIGALWLFLRSYRTRWSAIGWRRPKWSDPLWGLLMLVPYYATYYFLAVIVVHVLVPSVNLNQQQQIGFNDASGLSLVPTFISLVVLPPLVEEILVRGFLYSSLKKGLPLIAAAIVTSLIFATAHLQFGSGAPLLWVAFIDTFILSCFLIYLREKTGSLWAGITLHATKNFLAFLTLFVLGTHVGR